MRAAAEKLDNQLPNIFRYHDYRSYLKDSFEFYKNLDSGFSLRKIAQEAGISVGYLPMVLNGERNLSEKALSKILPFLKLTLAEQSYLRLLCTISDSNSQEERMQAVGRLKKFKEYEQYNSRELEAHQYLSKWYYVAIREMAACEGFKLDAVWIQERLNFSVAIGEIEKAIQFLLDNGFIVQSKKGIEAPVKDIDCFNGIYKLSLGEFHKQMLALAGRSIEEVPRELRLILGHTMAFPTSQFETVRKVLEKAYEEIQKIESKTKIEKDSVYHITLAAFPVGQKKKEGKE